MKTHVFLSTLLFALFTYSTFAQNVPTIDVQPWSIEQKDGKITKQLAKYPHVVFKGGLWLNQGRNIASKHRFGGLSAIWVSDHGTKLFAVSDYSSLKKYNELHYEKDGRILHRKYNSCWFQFDLTYDDNQYLIDAILMKSGQLADSIGIIIRGESEGVAVLGDTIYVSKDQDPYILLFDKNDFEEDRFTIQEKRRIQIVLKESFGKNDGIEAFTRTRDNKLFAIREMGNGKQKLRNAWLIDPKTPKDSIRYLDYINDFEEVKGATTLFNGDIVVLEKTRKNNRNKIKLVLVRQEDLEKEKPIHPSTTLLRLSSKKALDNIEGIASYARDGKEYLLLISDDNGDNRITQNTLLLHFELNLEYLRK